MTHEAICRAAEVMHGLTRRAQVLLALDEGPDTLAAALLPLEETRALYQLLTGSGAEPAAKELSACLTEEVLALMRLCAQCREGEVLTALTRCPLPATPALLAALVEERRRQEAMHLYGLQLLWRLCGDKALPDAMSLFAQEETNPAEEALICQYVIDHLKEAGRHG